MLQVIYLKTGTFWGTLVGFGLEGVVGKVSSCLQSVSSLKLFERDSSTVTSTVTSGSLYHYIMHVDLVVSDMSVFFHVYLP